ncbi:hypothetical protein, partial [Pseudomonas aeruginosa]|uniref:hypothetical protein n=1 Tax=Pseudomonas aeruginosa TaxID=287 RepID=UPI003CC50896
MEVTATGGLACSSTFAAAGAAAGGRGARRSGWFRATRRFGSTAGTGLSSLRRRNCYTPSRARTSSRTIFQGQCCESVG